MMTDFFNNVKLQTTEQQGSYGIGLQIGQQLVQSQLPVDVNAVAKGIFDVLNQNPPAADLNAVGQALQQMEQVARERQQAQFKEIEAAGKAFLEENKQADGVNVTESGLQYQVLTEGNGKVPSANDKVRVHYTGSLPDGTVFDSSVQRGQPAEFPVNGVIKGWTEALTMMPVGSKWRLVIPHELAYGERGAGQAIPPFSTLVFDVELLDIL
ncbi:FKBP-type peptidyl-prolyl cis-trans isomerase [Spirabiliibacterium falconis]|uniref:FKBP-type peptidyl-prolyl cis-trans isomerase n=1 Tax=Spirabiliibacterium falconis TaxID=572023 RepID=UPI001AAD53D6|nr:FKBP-type peptidyl-prolyl cis-trans isomerase [Spirabiliibacterium falconis]MBE2894781.1 peptidylprolyl isomerase [Spirabiliibacterium falconis]